MDITLDGGLNLSDPQALKQNELVISLNADFRKDGVVRSRDGSVSSYESTDSDLTWENLLISQRPQKAA